MCYLKVTWIHDHAEDPIELYSELDESREEQRKVEVYRDGTCDFAGRQHATGTTTLAAKLGC